MSDIRSISYAGGSPVTQSDTAADPAGPFASLVATTAAGVAKVTCIDGSVLTIYLLQGSIYPLEVTRVWASVTTATGILGHYAVGNVL